MFSGKHWAESEFLKKCYEDCLKNAQEDEEFKMFEFHDSLKRCLKRKIKEWTWIQEERDSILQEILEEKGGK